MKKKTFKLQLSRETLRSLSRGALDRVVGAESEPSNCIGCYPTIWTECVSGCIACPQSWPASCGPSCDC